MKYNPGLDELGFSKGQFEIFQENASYLSLNSFIFVPSEAVEKSEGD